jgi:hypothetical protein
MTKLDQINIDLIGIGRALMNKDLSVPLYQRVYAWEERHVLDLFQDINTAIQKGETQYFLGSIVTTKNETARPEVADGQQRLATVAILLAAIRDYFYNNDDKDRASTLTSTFLHRKDLATLEVIPKLKLNDTDNDFFLKRILTDPDSPDRAVEATTTSHRKIGRAAELAKEHITKVAKSPNPTQKLADLVEFIQDGVHVIWVSVSDDSNAFTIFETLNDRGLALAISDLLKNYLFGISKERLQEVQNRWVSMMGTLEAIEGGEIAVTFIRHWWSSKHGLIREKELYSHIKDHVRNKSQAVEFVTELAESVRLYTALLNASHELWEEYGTTTRQHMETLNLMRMIQIRPLLLAILHKFETDEVRDALRLMVSWVVRFLITGGLGGGTLEKHYCQAARDIRDDKIGTARMLTQALRDVIPGDTKFKSAFETATVSKQYLARYYLRALEKQSRGELEPELVPNDNQEMVTLEHILPQTLSPSWSHFSEESHAAFVNRLGNLALLKARINTGVGNDSFDFKKQFYKSSAYELTSVVARKAKWNARAISERQTRLATLAVKAWPLR